MGSIWLLVLVGIVMFGAGMTGGLFIARAAYSFHMKTLDAIFPDVWEEDENE